jgi:hypothetical protein
MGRFVCHLDGKFFEFSTVVDAPVTDLMSEEEFIDYYTRLYGEMAAESDHRDGMRARMQRARENGTSSMLPGDNDGGIEEFLKSNMFAHYGTYNEDTDDHVIDKWPGLEGFKREWFSDSDEPVVQLKDLDREGHDVA